MSSSKLSYAHPLIDGTKSHLSAKENGVMNSVSGQINTSSFEKVDFLMDLLIVHTRKTKTPESSDKT